MMRSLNIAATGMLAQQTNVDVISNNIANMSTTAFQRRRSEFQDLLYQNLRRVGASTSGQGEVVPTGVQIGLGVKAAGVYRITTQGNLIPTDNTFDLAVQGRGYFQIQLPTGETAYSRDGSFQLDPNGQLVTHDGYRVLPNITIPANAVDVAVNAEGQVLAKFDGVVEPQLVGQIQLATFANEAGLQAVGQNLFLETTASGQANVNTPVSPGYGSILQSFLEGSNINIVSEITSLITAQRAYEMNSKVIQTSDQMMSALNNLR